MSRRRRQQRLERVLGTPALFSTAYGNVGSSIYYALGVTAVFALVHAPLTETVRAPIAMGPALALEYRNVLVPIIEKHESEAAVDLACRLATERGASIVALTVLEMPLQLPLDAELPREVELRAHDLLDESRAIGDSYGVNVVGRIVRARNAGRAIVDEAERRNSEIIVMGALRRGVTRLRGRIFGDTVDFVLKNALSRVLVAAAPPRAA